jgi:hypothetical protein
VGAHGVSEGGAEEGEIMGALKLARRVARRLYRLTSRSRYFNEGRFRGREFPANHLVPGTRRRAISRTDRC